MEYAIETLSRGERRWGFRTFTRSYPEVSFKEIEVHLWNRLVLVSIRF